MIGKLRGFLDSLQEDKCIIDVGGVGYLVFVSQKTLQFLQQFLREKEISLIIETIVKEDALELYGFVSESEKIWFLELTKVQGVGAKMALKILGFFSLEELAKALISADVKSFTKISGIGPKLAQRITTELRDSPKKLGVNVGIDFSSAKNNSAKILDNKIVQDSLSALENLGYKRANALEIVEFVLANNPQATLENVITLCLRELSKNKF